MPVSKPPLAAAAPPDRPRRPARRLAQWLVAGVAVAWAQVAAGATPLAMAQAAPGVFVHVGAIEDWTPAHGGDVANIGFVVGSRCVAVIDTGGTPAVGQALQAAVEAATPLPVCYVISTHAHPDHVLGNVAFSETRGPAPQFVASARFGRALATRGPYYLNALRRDFGIEAPPTALVQPGIRVDGTLDLDLGDRVLSLKAWPTAHTDNDLTVLDRRTRTLFASDLLFVRHLPVIDGSLRGWIATLAELRRLDVAVVVPGHGAVSRDWPAAMDAQADYLNALLGDTRAALREGLTIQQAVERIGVRPAAHWLLTERFHRRNVTAAYAELEWEDAEPKPPATPAAGERPRSN